MADGRKSRDSVKAIGSATETVIDFKGEEHDLVLNNALYIPDFKESIFSVYRSVKNGHTVVFSPEESYLLTKKGTKFDLVERNKLFYLKKHNNHEVKSVQKMKKKVEKGKVAEHSLKTWHRMLGHCNVKDVKCLEGVVKGMKISDKEPFDCVTCLLGKATNLINKTPRERSTKVLQLVHCDLSGPLNPEARGGFKYGINFVDDLSGATKVYLLKRKSDA